MSKIKMPPNRRRKDRSENSVVTITFAAPKRWVLALRKKARKEAISPSDLLRTAALAEACAPSSEVDVHFNNMVKTGFRVDLGERLVIREAADRCYSGMAGMMRTVLHRVLQQ